MAHRFLISQDSPVLYITIVTKDTTSIRIRCAPGWLNEQQTIFGPALASGKVVRWRMNLCRWTKISFIGDEVVGR